MLKYTLLIEIDLKLDIVFYKREKLNTNLIIEIKADKQQLKNAHERI